jgi:hypothetical protein
MPSAGVPATKGAHRSALCRIGLRGAHAAYATLSTALSMLSLSDRYAETAGDAAPRLAAMLRACPLYPKWLPPVGRRLFQLERRGASPALL